jgi:hypothetical protein
MAKARDYKAEYKKFHSSPLQISDRSKRNQARSLMIKAHGKAAVKGKDIDHKDGNPQHGAKSNLAITSVKYNRGKH